MSEMFSGEKLEIGQLTGHHFNNPDTARGWLRIRRVAWKQNWEAQSPKPQRKELNDLATFQDSGTGKMGTNDETQQSQQLTS